MNGVGLGLTVPFQQEQTQEKDTLPQVIVEAATLPLPNPLPPSQLNLGERKVEVTAPSCPEGTQIAIQTLALQKEQADPTPPALENALPAPDSSAPSHDEAFIVPANNYFRPSVGIDRWNGQGRKAIYNQTLQAMNHGYKLNDKWISLSGEALEKMLAGAQVCTTIAELPPVEKPLITEFYAVDRDTLDVMLGLKSQGKNPIGMIMANRTKRGGGVEYGDPQQEECIYRRSNCAKMDDKQDIKKVVLNEEVIYAPSVTVFRKGESDGYAFMEEPQTLAFVSVAGVDLRERDLRDQLGINKSATKEELLNNPLYFDGVKNRIRNVLRLAGLHGHTDVVLGALGCGAFLNPVEAVTVLYSQVLDEKEFKGRFSAVWFAVLSVGAQGPANLKAFGDLCDKLNQPS